MAQTVSNKAGESPDILDPRPDKRLPPGQRAIRGFPRFGTHLDRPAPPVPDDPTIEIVGAGLGPLTLPLSALATLPRRRVVADFHCVSGWSALDLEWEGVPFAALYREIVEPALDPDTRVTHLVFGGLDGYRSIVQIEDALDDDVLIADRLRGRPLNSAHGAPARLLSPHQYGFVSAKHLCRVELHTSPPPEGFGPSPLLTRVLLRPPFFKRHPRSRVWHEERHAYLPAWLVRPVYGLIVGPTRFVIARAGRRR